MYLFCPKCGGCLEERFIEVDNKKRYICQRCGFVFYPHSKPCAGALVVSDGAVLLVQRAIEPFKGFWDIPGGFLEVGEHPMQGAVRELQEETGLLIEPIEILDIFMDLYGQEQEATLNICYVARVIGGELKAGSDAAEVKWFRMDSLPKDIAFKWAREALDLLQNKLNCLPI